MTRSTIPYVGADGPESPWRGREAFALFERAPDRNAKAAIKAMVPAGWKAATRGRVMMVTLPHDNRDADVRALWAAAHEACPIALTYRELRIYDRTRSTAHREALAIAWDSLAAFDADLAGGKDTMGRRFLLGLLCELHIADPDRAWRPAHLELLVPALRRMADDRGREFFMAMVNTPDALLAELPKLVWAPSDAVAFLWEIAERLTAWGEDLSGVRLRAAQFLADRIARDGMGEPDLSAPAIAGGLWVGLHAALQGGERTTIRALREAVRGHGSAASVRLVYGDLRRHHDDPRLVALADEVLAPDVVMLQQVGDWLLRRHPPLALELYDRAAATGEASWEAINNGVAMLLAAHEGSLPGKLAATWLGRIAGLSPAPARHNHACLLARLGKVAAAKTELLAAISGGADLDPIAGDPELVALLDDPAVIAALDARAPDPAVRGRLEVLRLIASGRLEDAVEAAISAAAHGADPDELAHGEAFAAIADHPRISKVRRARGRKR